MTVRYFLSIAFICVSTQLFSQISMQDSSAQAVAYWNKGDKQTYNVSLVQTRLKGADTSSVDIITYSVDVQIVDSTKDSYSVAWKYYNMQSNSANDIINKITQISNNITVLIKVNELGVFQQVLNWEEVRDSIQSQWKQIEVLLREYPNIAEIEKKVLSMYTSRQAIESAAIQDIQQFHTFHGGKYILNEKLQFPIEVPNVYNVQKPFVSQVKLSLDTINEKDGVFRITSYQEIDPQQLRETTISFLQSIGNATITEDMIGKLENITETQSVIHESGWIVNSIQTTTVTTQGVTNIKERIIELK